MAQFKSLLTMKLYLFILLPFSIIFLEQTTARSSQFDDDLQNVIKSLQSKIEEVRIKEEDYIQQLKWENKLRNEKNAENIHQLELENSQLMDRIRKMEQNRSNPANGLPGGKAASILRSCNEYLKSNSSLPSGKYFIDPDGSNYGDPAFEVHCDMENGMTTISHDSEGKIQVTKCSEPGCYSRVVTYSTTKNQIAALKRLSESCSQRIQYDCILAPFQFNEVDQSWWNTMDGDNRYYWAGNNNTIHTCQCGIQNICIDNTVKCNCDAYLVDIRSDIGFISNKDDLPIAQLNFGRLSTSISEAYHTLGPLECKGNFNGVPTSCTDLWALGHQLNGFYTIQKNNVFQLVFCDMSKQNTGDMEIFQGVLQPKYPEGILFDAYNTKPSTGPTKLQYENVNAQGCAVVNGSFTAPKTGFYSFSFLSFTTTVDSKADIVVNERHTIASSIISTSEMNTLSINVLAHLNISDTVAVYLIGSLGTGNNAAYTHFSGALLDGDEATRVNKYSP